MDAIEPIYLYRDILEKKNMPSHHARNVFDFMDGLRMVVDRERHDLEAGGTTVILHVGSTCPGRISNELRSIEACPTEVAKFVARRFADLSGTSADDYCPGQVVFSGGGGIHLLYQDAFDGAEIITEDLSDRVKHDRNQHHGAGDQP